VTSCRFSRWRISAILDFMGPIMGSLKIPSTTSYRSSVDTIALNCLVFEKIAFLQFGDRQTDRQTNRWTGPLHTLLVCTLISDDVTDMTSYTLLIFVARFVLYFNTLFFVETTLCSIKLFLAKYRYCGIFYFSL